MPAEALTVDQSLVDAFLARVDRFVNNVQSFGETLTEMLNHQEPEVSAIETPVYQEAAAAAPVENVVTADDIDIDALLSGLDLSGMGL